MDESFLNRHADELRLRALACRIIAERVLDALLADELRALAQELMEQADRLAAGETS